MSFEVNEGETVSVMLGAQGGKTTAAKLIMGLLKPTCGKITADGAPLEETPPKARKIAYFCFPPLAFKTTVGKNVSRVLRLNGFGKTESSEKAAQALKRFGLEGLARKKAASLDGEGLLKLSLARAWAKKAEFFIVDGPTNEIFVDKITALAAELGASTLLLCDSPASARGRILDFLPKFNLTEEFDEPI